jgi:hypothetical protein
MTGSYEGDKLVVLLVAFVIGAIVGVVMRWRRVPFLIAVFITPLPSAILLSFVWFLWVTITTAIHGHPAGNNPILVGIAAVFFFAIGFSLAGAVPSSLGCLTVYTVSWLWVRWRPPFAREVPVAPKVQQGPE